MKRYQEYVDPFDPKASRCQAFVFPTKEFTKNSRYKIIRLLGRVLQIPMFPWEVFAFVCVTIIFLILYMIGELYDWWEQV